VSRQIRTGEILTFGESDGEIRTAQLRPDRLSISFDGTVRGMSTGDEHERRSLMPTWLDWLKAQHGLSLLWGSSLSAAGIAMAVLRWFKGAS
jgi:hypothetical protein